MCRESLSATSTKLEFSISLYNKTCKAYTVYGINILEYPSTLSQRYRQSTTDIKVFKKKRTFADNMGMYVSTLKNEMRDSPDSHHTVQDSCNARVYHHRMGQGQQMICLGSTVQMTQFRLVSVNPSSSSNPVYLRSPISVDQSSNIPCVSGEREFPPLTRWE